jgi:hypothetical protein
VNKQSVVVSLFVAQLGVPNDHSVEVNAKALLGAGLSPAAK